MDINFYDNCITLAILASCIIKSDDMEYIHLGYRKPIKFNDELQAVINYESLCSKNNSKEDYEIHKFFINFYKKDSLIYNIDYEKKLNKKYYGSLVNPRLSVEEKLEVLKVLRPNLIDKAKVYLKSVNLTPKDIKDVEKRCTELKQIVNDLKNNKKVLKKMR